MTTIDLKNWLAEHFYYEIEMLYYSIIYLEILRTTNNQICKNSSLENFCLHTRNIVEFLFHDKSIKYPDNARSSDFLTPQEWSNLKLGYSAELQTLYTRASKEVDHLTYSRINGTPPEKQWNYGRLFNLVITEVKNFLDVLPNEYDPGTIIDKLKKLELL